MSEIHTFSHKPLPLSRQVLQNMRHKHFANKNWAHIHLDSSDYCHRGSRASNSTNPGFSRVLNEHNTLQGTLSSCHSAPQSPMHPKGEKWQHFARVPRVEHQTNPKYVFTKACSIPRQSDPNSNSREPRSEKWGSLDYATSVLSRPQRANASIYTGSGTSYVIPREHKVRHSSAGPCTTGTPNLESGLHREGIKDESQKRKIMSNYLVIRALLSSTDGKLSEGACHPLLSINNV